MLIEACEIPDVKLVRSKQFRDSRGFFSEVYSKSALAGAGLTDEFVQDNHSFSALAGTVRGLHFQKPPFAQAKLVRVTRGSILDIALDLRRASPHFGRHVARVLSAENWEQLYIPTGFAHAFCSLEPDTEVLYKVTSYYAPDADAGVLWSDPELGIDWPVASDSATVSEKDARLPRLRDLEPVF